MKKLILALILGSCAVVFASCGNNGNDTNSNDTNGDTLGDDMQNAVDDAARGIENGAQDITDGTMFDTDNNEILLADDIVLLCRDRNNKYYDIFQKMHEVYYVGASNWELLLKSCFYSFLADLIYQLSYDKLKNSSLSSVIYNGIVELENNYMSNISIGDLAKKCAVSETTFRRNFTKLKGMSPVSYRNDLRLKHAYNFLMSGLYSVSEVMEMVGFNELPYFSRSFKKKFGITPMECIKKIKNLY